jgi:hypothetical protein
MDQRIKIWKIYFIMVYESNTYSKQF